MIDQDHLQTIRAESLKAAISLGLSPAFFQVTWEDSAPVFENGKYAIPSSIKKDATPQHLSFWNRIIEPSQNYEESRC